MADIARPFLSIERRRLAAIQVQSKQIRFFLVKDNGVYSFDSKEVVENNGWSLEDVESVTREEFAELPFRGVIDEANPALYGPLKK